MDKFVPNYTRCRQCNILYTKQKDHICLMCKKVCYRCKFKDKEGNITYNAMLAVNIEHTLFRCAICGYGFDIESKEFLMTTRKK